MKTIKNLFTFFINKPLYMKLLFVALFVIYGAIISTISYSISNYYQTQNTKSKLLEAQKQSFKMKTNSLQIKMDVFVNNLNSLSQSNIFKEYVKNKNLNSGVIDIFSILMGSNKELSQFRYIDENGKEKIRFDRKALGQGYEFIEEKRLQNKASRYYFKEIKKLNQGEIWYSKLDLNIEHGIIVKPIVPTLRIGLPIYEKDTFRGIVIMNIFFDDIINKFVDSTFFNISIFDKDGEFIHNKLDLLSGTINNSWSRYLQKDFNLYKYNEYLKKLTNDSSINEYFFSKSISTIIPNGDDLSVFYEPKILKLKEIEESETNYILTVTLIVLLSSIPLAFIISIIPNMLNDELYKTKKMLEREIKVIDEYVYLSITDKDGVILDVSEAYASLTGFSKEDLIGSKHSVLKHDDTELSTYKDLWNTILNKEVWKGEIKNKKQDGTAFNAKLLIKPNLDDDGDISTFTAYVQDITYQKEVERISVTDELTKLYNKREFNKIFERSIEQAKRFHNPFSMIILDIDYFKQYNDTYGHLQGDIAIAEVARVIRESCKRSTDIGFRLGGEEFGILFTANNLDDAINFAQKIRREILSLEIEHETSLVSPYLTVSMGLFFKDDLYGFSKDDIYQRCDDALYFAKDYGRNQVFVIDTRS